MHLKSGKFSNTLCLVSFFIITIAYSSIFGDYDSWNRIKFIGFIVIVGLLVICGNGRTTITKSQLGLCIYFALFTLMSIATQDLSLSGSILACFYTLVLLLYVLRGCELFNNYTYFYAAIGIILGIVIVMYFSQSIIATQFFTSRNGRIRVFGLFSHPNIYASMLLSIIMLLDIGVRKNNFKRIVNYMCYAVIVVACFLMYLTNSRTTMIMAVSYYAIIFYNILRKKFTKGNRFIFVVFILVVALVIGYLFFTEYILKQETFYMRLDDYREFTLSGKEWVFGKSFSSSLEGRSFEFAIYTILYRVGIAGLIGYILLLLSFVKQCRKQRGNYLCWACVTTLAVSALAEAYIMNITHLFSCIIYLLISTEIYNSAKNNNENAFRKENS